MLLIKMDENNTFEWKVNHDADKNILYSDEFTFSGYRFKLSYSPLHFYRCAEPQLSGVRELCFYSEEDLSFLQFPYTISISDREGQDIICTKGKIMIQNDCQWPLMILDYNKLRGRNIIDSNSFTVRFTINRKLDARERPSIRKGMQDINSVSSPTSYSETQEPAIRVYPSSLKYPAPELIPCEFCNKRIPFDDIVEHTTGCDPELVSRLQKNPSSYEKKSGNYTQQRSFFEDGKEFSTAIAKRGKKRNEEPGEYLSHSTKGKEYDKKYLGSDAKSFWGHTVDSEEESFEQSSDPEEEMCPYNASINKKNLMHSDALRNTSTKICKETENRSESSHEYYISCLRTRSNAMELYSDCLDQAKASNVADSTTNTIPRVTKDNSTNTDGGDTRLLETLSSDFSTFYENKTDTDCVLKVSDGQFNVHRAILSARSSVFSAMFHHDTAENRTGEVNIPDVKATLSDVLHYIYSGKIRGLTADTAASMYTVADKYDLPELRTECFEFLKRNLTMNNFCEAALLAHTHGEMELEERVVWFIEEKLDEVLESNTWQQFLKDKTLLSNKLLTSALMSSKKKVSRYISK